MTDLSLPHTVLTVRQTVQIFPLRRAVFTPGVYYFEGDVRSKIRSTADRRQVALGLYQLEYRERAPDAPTEVPQEPVEVVATPADPVEVPAALSTDPVPEVASLPVTDVTDAAVITVQPAEAPVVTETVVSVETPIDPPTTPAQPEVVPPAVIRGNTRASRLPELLAAGRVQFGDVVFSLEDGNVVFDHRGETYCVPADDLRALTVTVSAYIAQL